MSSRFTISQDFQCNGTARSSARREDNPEDVTGVPSNSPPRPAHTQSLDRLPLPLSGCQSLYVWRMVCTACPHPSQGNIQVQTLLRFRMGCHNLPWDLGRRQGIPRLHRVCTLCAGENPGDEQHVVFECPGLQDIRDRYQGLFGEHELPYHASIHVAR